MMPAPNPDDSLLLIRCPSCGQRFKVGEDLRERTVECGGCEHRFRIDDDSIVRGRKIYPGERKSAGLNRFQRVPLSGAPAPEGMQAVNYGSVPDPAVLEPASPLRILAGGIGAGGIVVMALLLIFGARRGGLLDGMLTRDRLLMGGFAAVMGIALLVYANPRARLKGFVVGLLLSCGMMAVPFFFQTGSIPLASGSDRFAEESPAAAGSSAPAPGGDAAMIALRERIGNAPLDAETARLERDGSDRHALGLWLVGLSDSNRYLVRDYILRAAHASPTSHLYPRDDGSYLMVVTGIRISLQELAEIAGALGKVSRLHQEIGVAEVQVINENFVEGPIEKLSDSSNPAFYDLNKRELESIDLSRVKRAVERLGGAEPKIYRDDITRELISLLGEKAVDFKGAVCSALEVWAAGPGPAGDAALAELQRLVAEQEEVPPEMIALLVHEKNEGVIPVLDELWFKNPTEWETLYGDIGAAAEPTLLRRFPETSGMVRHSAVRLLGRVGTEKSLEALSSAEAAADSELRVLIDNARKAISARANQ